MSDRLNYADRYRHPNLIALMGFCNSKAMLVYLYMQRESLFKNLHEWKVGTAYDQCTLTVLWLQVDEPLSWLQHLAILTDTCRGHAYLHSEQPPVIRHDINSCVFSFIYGIK